MITEREPDLSITSGAFWGRNPHAELQWIRHHDPVYFDEASGVWGISRYGDIKAIESDPVTFSNAGGIRPETGPIPMMIDMDDPEHRMRRKLVARGFTPNRVREQEPGIGPVVHGREHRCFADDGDALHHGLQHACDWEQAARAKVNMQHDARALHGGREFAAIGPGYDFYRETHRP